MTDRRGQSHWQSEPQDWNDLKTLVREQRENPTPAEDRLWQRLRNRRLGGLKFRRQHTIGRYIADFHCAQAKLVVEIDGSAHSGATSRTASGRS